LSQSAVQIAATRNRLLDAGNVDGCATQWHSDDLVAKKRHRQAVGRGELWVVVIAQHGKGWGLAGERIKERSCDLSRVGPMAVKVAKSPVTSSKS
jgi:hypothetical protein